MRGRVSSNLIAVIDIGTSKVLCAIGQFDAATQKINVLSLGHQASRGIKKGQIVDLESIEGSILHAVHAAEEAAGERLSRIVLNISGAQILSEWVEVSADMAGSMIDDDDMARLLDFEESGTENSAYHILHSFPLSYSVGDQKGIEDPRGMHGSTLKSMVHVITSTLSPVRNLMTACRRCHLEIGQIVASSVAAGHGALVDDEMDLGVCVIDIGAGVTDIAVFHRGKCLFTDVIPAGGLHITQDIAHAFSLTISDAERLKILYGSGIMNPSDRKEFLPLPPRESDDGPKTILKSELLEVITARLEEIFELVMHRLTQKGLQEVVSKRFVLTGGVSQMLGVREFASRFLQTQVRLGKPLGIEGEIEGLKNPAFVTCAGLMRMALHQEKRAPAMQKKGLMRRMGVWVKENF